MNTTKEFQRPIAEMLDRAEVNRRGSRLSVVASAIASVLATILYIVCESAYMGPPYLRGDLETSLTVSVLLFGPLLAFVFSVIPAQFGGRMLAVVLWLLIRRHDKSIVSMSLALIIGGMTGGLVGYGVALMGYWLVGLAHTVGPDCGYLAGILAGGVTGIWYAYRITHWLYSTKV